MMTGTWLSDWPPARPSSDPQQRLQQLPRAVEVSLEHPRYGLLTRTLRLPDNPPKQNAAQPPSPDNDTPPEVPSLMKRQQGVALITVLLVVAIVTVVSAGIIARQQLSIRRCRQCRAPGLALRPGRRSAGPGHVARSQAGRQRAR